MRGRRWTPRAEQPEGANKLYAGSFCEASDRRPFAQLTLFQPDQRTQPGGVSADHLADNVFYGEDIFHEPRNLPCRKDSRIHFPIDPGILHGWTAKELNRFGLSTFDSFRKSCPQGTNLETSQVNEQGPQVACFNYEALVVFMRDALPGGDEPRSHLDTFSAEGHGRPVPPRIPYPSGCDYRNLDRIHNRGNQNHC